MTRYLMCPPFHYEVSYSINPWMNVTVDVDRDLAKSQWFRLFGAIDACGGSVELIDPVEGLPDMVFVANGGLIDGEMFLPASMRHPQRQGEKPYLCDWFAERGWKVLEPPDDFQEGAGDALVFNGQLIGGYGMRSQLSAYPGIHAQTGWDMRLVRLADPRFYHLDIAFCPLNSDSALIVPAAFDAASLKALRDLVPDPIELTIEEALAFSANSVVIGNCVIMSACSERLRHLLGQRGFDVLLCDMSEFVKAGGGCRCLTLALDTVIGEAA